MGSASLFFLIQPRSAVLADSCADLVATFEAVREDVGQVLEYLRQWKPDRDFYYKLRKSRSRGRFRRAAEFIYLNKTCWNGLYRVNSVGDFNVPYGRPKSDNLIDEENLRACSRAMRSGTIQLLTGDFEQTLIGVKAGDLVFLDPPYVTRHNNNGFIDYNERLFGWSDQVRLSKIARQLAHGGACVIVSNAAHQDVLDLYPTFDQVLITRTSTLAGDTAARGVVKEALLVAPGR